jgi:hypothetical protein
MDVYTEFEAAWVDHIVFGNGHSRLADARGQMKAQPAYSERKYIEAVFRAERTAEAFRAQALSHAMRRKGAE